LPTLEELQRWARGERVEGLPERGPVALKPRKLRPIVAPNVPLQGQGDEGLDAGPDLDEATLAAVFASKRKKPKAEPPTSKKLKYKVSADGTDALIQFGKHRGSTLAIIHAKDAGYLVWLGRQDWVPPDLMDVVKYVLAEPIRLFFDC
jgi:hypothetical protein